MITWGEFRTKLRRTILNDNSPDEESGDYRWSDEILLDCLGWALDQFALHTAQATATSFAAATGTVFPMPENVLDVEPLDYSIVALLRTSAGVPQYLDPIHYTKAFQGSRNQSDVLGFYVYPEQTICLTKETEAAGSTLEVQYYAYYNHPSSDFDTIDVPKWAYTALSYLTASHALSGAGLKTAIIRQWGAKPDTGTPEHNPIRAQQEWFLCLYDKEMLKHKPQPRTNHYREYD